jgi:hypothetical protein
VKNQKSEEQEKPRSWKEEFQASTAMKIKRLLV